MSREVLGGRDPADTDDRYNPLPVRIYADESGTHSDAWLVIGMLFVPDHGVLHADLCGLKDKVGYLNTSPKKKAQYKEIHFAELKSPRDATMAKCWIDRFLSSGSVFRSVVVDWSIFQPRYFGNPFEPEALKKRRAYKKWTEMLLQPEVHRVQDGRFYLDRLRVLYGYDVLDHLKDRFTLNEFGERRSKPRIAEFQATDSWRDANQCLQLCDLLTGAVYQKLVPSSNAVKLEVTDHLYESLKAHGVKERSPGYWRGFGDTQLSAHFPKFSEWYWRPTKK